MRIVVTGGDGFLGRNLRVRLGEAGHTDVVSLTRGTAAATVENALASADFVFHLAAANRPADPSEFTEINVRFTAAVCAALEASRRSVPIVYSSSAQATLDTPYGRSKRAGELAVERYGAATGARAIVVRPPNIFGKWARPNYNSVVATFCHNIARDLSITIHDPATPLHLVYVDDVVDAFIGMLDLADRRTGLVEVGPVYATSVGALAGMLREFAESRRSRTIPRVGTGLTRALYATYVSYLPPDAFAYGLQRHEDSRGVFVELLRTLDSGQFSYFTAPPGVTRGEHYHHSKTEKFLVVKGTARFAFRHLVSGETFEILVRGDASRVVETVPGWVHSIMNVGGDEIVVLLWANEVFDPQKPDTIASAVKL
ncbi:MAG: capsular biosynthesis protein [Gemmatimonadetes bacterium]|nr:MAG: capsular biosynthesis protein [Gemmatimonadota bacterium]